ncbi:MAG: ComF family protein [Salinivirgaceae bacterium]|nr:ComF family protein [Salinivirgaceae bacterium]MDY0280751.1 ComF family protein [Salinivirgaceae bacterium]
MVNYRKISIFEDVLNLFYPRLCAGCGEPLIKGESHVCLRCLYQMHRTGFHNVRDNRIEQLFWGKVQVKYATAYSFYHKESNLQHMIHKLKYHGEKEIGYVLGVELGLDLKDSVFNEVDIIVPIPLHPKRQRKRGYNQAEWIANGISSVMNRPVDTTSVLRAVATETQTKKGRFERWQNVENIFEIADTELLKHKHILVVDDVITTGSTIEACLQTIVSVEGAQVSIACIGVADN